MNKIISLIVIYLITISCVKIPITEVKPIITNINNTWCFIMVGQSNMAGRAIVESTDNFMISNRIKFIDPSNNILIAQEPLHRYEPNIAGLDCGLSFATELLKKIPDSINILLIPCAIGGTGIDEWNNDQVHANIQLLTNLTTKVNIAKHYGIIKGLLWHQGENDANGNTINYEAKLKSVFNKIRTISNNDSLPIYAGELPTFDIKRFGTWYMNINNTLNSIQLEDKNVHIISTNDFTDVGDSLHFDSKSQREFGKRFANEIKIN